MSALAIWVTDALDSAGEGAADESASSPDEHAVSAAMTTPQPTNTAFLFMISPCLPISLRPQGPLEDCRFDHEGQVVWISQLVQTPS